jgi:hypothetical protein
MIFFTKIRKRFRQKRFVEKIVKIQNINKL